MSIDEIRSDMNNLEKNTLKPLLKHKYVINCLHGRPIYCDSFDDLTDNTKIELADKLCDRYPFSLENTVVEYILSKSIEDSEAPFSYDDLSNSGPTGSIEINGVWEELTEEGRDAKLEHIEYLRDKWEDYHSKLEDLELSISPQKYDLWFDRTNKAYNKFLDLDSLCDELKDMDFEDYPEIYQWFSVDSWILSKLEERGKCILDGSYWGRQAYGQSITLDRVIQDIAFEVLAEEVR